MYKNISESSLLEAKTEGEYLKKELYALIRKDESIFDFIQESALDGIWFWDLDNPENGWMNPKFWNTFGYNPKDIPHQSSVCLDIINKEDLAQAINDFNKHCKNPMHPYDQVVRYQHKMGNTVWIHCKSIVIRDEKGKPVRMLGAHTDITKLKKTELNLQKQVEHYQHIIDGTNIGTWEWNVQSGEVIYNERWAKIIGYSLLELHPTSIKTWTNNVHPDDFKKSEQALQDHFEGKTPIYELEARMKHKNGDWVWILARGKVVSWTVKGEPEWMIGAHQEITKQKKDQEKYRLFIEQAPSTIAMFDTNICYIAYSKKWIADYKLKDENIIGKSHYEIFPEIGSEWKQDHQDCLSGKILRCDEDRFEREDGSVQWISWELHPWYKDDNKIGGIIMLTADITRTKEAEIKLKVSEKTFRGNFENAAIGMAITGLDGKWSKVNETLCNILGYTSEELMRLNFQDITHPDDLEADLDLVQELLDGKRSFYHMEKRYLHKNKGIVNVILSASIIRDENESPLYFISQVTDITPRIHAREKLEKALSQLEGIFEASTRVSIVQTDLNGVITKFNKGAENLLGYKRAEVVGKETIKIIHLKEEMLKYGEELSSKLERKVDGFNIFKISLKKEKHITKEWTHVRKDGTQFPVQLTTTAIKNADKITGYLGVATDISEIKKVEKEIKSLLQVANDQNERLKNFAHIVSHNLKSHSGNFNMLLDFYIQENPSIENDEIIKLFRMASRNLTETISHLNEVVLMNTSVDQNLVRLNLNLAITKVMSGITLSARKAEVTIINRVDKSVNVLGVCAYMDSILLNFITNSIKYRSLERDSYVILNTYIDGDFVVLTVKDNGLGIDLNAHHAKLFGMYKTFHQNEDARGIGLFITKNQVEALGGKIDVESKVNQGTTFKIYLKHEKN
ncbi:PAS domain S-box protein [Aquimarina longa]|uniref:PAS domain S-box protein n=1 Tax=Aquimarina longa TaxID=1080221 RepID=UPI000781F117|nr:PAS domain S-box protein [Aquimarina longa]